jgi:CheY-like chemotaxis protein
MQQQRSNHDQQPAVSKGTVHDRQGGLRVPLVQPTVLVVDDDRDIRDSLTHALVEGGYTAVGVANGQEALQWLRTARPAPFLILLDLTMPVMNGWQFRSEQQRDPGLAAIPVLIVSANADAARQAVALAAAGHLAKPVDADQLLAWIRWLGSSSS